MNKPFIHARLIVLDTLQLVDGLIKPKRRSSIFGRDSLEMLGIIPRYPVTKPIWLCPWTPPAPNKYAHHVDSSSLDDSISIGAVIQNSTGLFVGAVYRSAGTGCFLTSEILALKWGLELAQRLNIFDPEIWSESKKIVDIIDGSSPLWNLCQVWKTIQIFLRHSNLGVHHTMHEENMVADALAKCGQTLPQPTFFFAPQDLPVQIQRLIAADIRTLGFRFLHP